MKASQMNRSLLQTPGCLLVLVLLSASAASAFPSLFNLRTPSLFRRQQPQPLQQVHQPKHHDQLVPSENSQFGVEVGGGPMQPVAVGELLRISSMHRAEQQPQQISAHQLQQNFMGAASQPHQFGNLVAVPPVQSSIAYNDVEQANAALQQFQQESAAATAFYQPSAVIARGPAGPASAPADHQEHSTFDLTDNAPGHEFPPQVGTNELRASQSGRQAASNTHQLHLEPTHTSEIVDKIEQQIGQQIEQSLGQHQEKLAPGRQAAASGYHEQASEKEPAHEPEEREEAADEGPAGEERLEKRNHHQEEAHKHEEHHHHHHEEHPPEAFEVHHKKGGKSFQYFHQGHSH